MTTKMAAVLKHWREASTLILATARQRGSNVKPNFVSSSPEPADIPLGGSFEVLLLKRSAKSRFMPNLYVFPGGVASDVDFSADWIPVFDLLGSDQRQSIFDFVQRGCQGAPMFSRMREPCFSQIPSEIAFRICAIRETFEESGVLLVRSVDNGETFQPTLCDGPSAASYSEDASVINEWRHKVDCDPNEFLRMCQELRVVPDVWSLYEWSNWLTPIGSSRRFDTAFYICCVDGKPHVAEDEGETVHSQWGEPEEIISQYYQGKVNVAPPQLYEIRRLMQFASAPDLLNFSWRRSQHRVQRWLPVRVNAADALFSVLPGDSLFPEDVDPEGPTPEINYAQTAAELAFTHPRSHRTQFVPDSQRPDGMVFGHVDCNILQHGDHVSPASTIVERFKEDSGRNNSTPSPKL